MIELQLGDTRSRFLRKIQCSASPHAIYASRPTSRTVNPNSTWYINQNILLPKQDFTHCQWELLLFSCCKVEAVLLEWIFVLVSLPSYIWYVKQHVRPRTLYLLLTCLQQRAHSQRRSKRKKQTYHLPISISFLFSDTAGTRASIVMYPL